MEFKLKSEFIELDNMLKAMELVASGAQAKQQILAGAVSVNGQVERRIRRKLRSGDVVAFASHQVQICVQGHD